jgi:hypothetical protein
LCKHHALRLLTSLRNGGQPICRRNIGMTDFWLIQVFLDKPVVDSVDIDLDEEEEDQDPTGKGKGKVCLVFKIDFLLFIQLFNSDSNL